MTTLFSTASNLFSLIALTVSVYRAATNNNAENAVYILNSGKAVTLVESLVRHLTVSHCAFGLCVSALSLTQGLKGDDLTASNVEQSESEQLAQIDLVMNLANVLAGLLAMFNTMVIDIRKRASETNEDKLTISRVTDLIR